MGYLNWFGSNRPHRRRREKRARNDLRTCYIHGCRCVVDPYELTFAAYCSRNLNSEEKNDVTRWFVGEFEALGLPLSTEQKLELRDQLWA